MFVYMYILPDIGVSVLYNGDVRIVRTISL